MAAVATQQVRDPDFFCAARMANGLARVAELRSEAAAWLLARLPEESQNIVAKEESPPAVRWFLVT